MRSYRETRFLVDPAGFEVQAGAGDGYREEKIDLPPSWLRGFLQLQAAMSLPMRRVPISREGLYNILAFLKRHRAARSPRAVRFELEPGRPPWVVLEPWDQRVRLGDAPYPGSRSEVIRIWGRDRLQLLARLLPLLDAAEVYLLGTGLPSFWSIRMGPMRLILGLSGWTANDWTGAAALDQLAPPAEPDAATMTGDRRGVPHRPGAVVRPASDDDRRRGAGPGRRAESAGAARPGDPRPARGPLSMAADHAGDALGRADRPRAPRDRRRAAIRRRRTR